MSTENMFVTVAGFDNYFGREPLSIGTELVCIKKPDNVFDSEGILATMPEMGTAGYIANGVNTKANGTSTAGRIYDKVGERSRAKVLFTTHSKVIAQVLDTDACECPQEHFIGR